jgi:sensor domain CHASE-containing protein
LFLIIIIALSIVIGQQNTAIQQIQTKLSADHDMSAIEKRLADTESNIVDLQGQTAALQTSINFKPQTDSFEQKLSNLSMQVQQNTDDIRTINLYSPHNFGSEK